MTATKLRSFEINGVVCNEWYLNDVLGVNNLVFRVGTVHGMFGKFEEGTLQLIAIGNDEIGNGDFAKAMDWYEKTAFDMGLKPEVVEIWNQGLKKHLIEKRGYVISLRGVVKND